MSRLSTLLIGQSFPLIFVCLVSVFSPDLVFAINEEGPRPSQPSTRRQTTDDLRHFWNFDTEQPGQAPKGFSTSVFGNGSAGTWKIQAYAQSPSAPNGLIQSTPCSTEAADCLHILLAEASTYEYPDLSVRFQPVTDVHRGAAGLIFGAADEKNFYAAIVDMATNTVEVLQVLDGQVRVLGRQPVQGWKSDWHRLRAQHNTILSKDYVEITFDGHVVFSIWQKAMGSGKIGLVTKGDAAIVFDDLNAIQLFSQRPLSPPAAY